MKVEGEEEAVVEGRQNPPQKIQVYPEHFQPQCYVLNIEEHFGNVLPGRMDGWHGVTVAL